MAKTAQVTKLPNEEEEVDEVQATPLATLMQRLEDAEALLNSKGHSVMDLLEHVAKSSLGISLKEPAKPQGAQRIERT